MDTPVPSSPPGVSPRATWARRAARLFLILTVSLVLLSAAYLWFVLSWSYSTGERAGYVQKFSRKGIVSKTWEGELAMVALPGSTPEKFYFTVPDDAVAAQVNATMGRKVAVSYEQHIGVPTSLFGETEYFVTGVRVVE